MAYRFPTPRCKPLLVKKSTSWLLKLIGALVSFIVPDFVRNMWTTIVVPFGRAKVYVPSRYDIDADWGQVLWYERHKATLKHEYIHVWRAEKWSALVFYIAYIGPAPFVFLAACVASIWCLNIAILGFIISACLIPLSVGLAYGRWFIEREAYMVQIMLTDRGARPVVIAWIADTLWSNYGWTWPKSWMENWFTKEAKRLDG